MNIKLGIYAGSFNPFTIGHLNILQQAMKVFDKILVAKGYNPEKTGNVVYPLPSTLLKDMGIECCNFSGLLTDLVKSKEAENYDVTLVRGLRNGADLEYEQNMLAFLKDMHPKLKAVAFYCDPLYRHVSSSNVRGLSKISSDEFRKYAIVD